MRIPKRPSLMTLAIPLMLVLLFCLGLVAYAYYELVTTSPEAERWESVFREETFQSPERIR